MKSLLKEMKINELEETMKLVKRVFDEFEAPYYTIEGIENFYKFANYDNIKKQLNKNMKIFIMKDDNKIVGMIAVKDYSHIALLFVDKKYHRKKIATKLLEEAKFYCRKNNKNIKEITVNSSICGIKFYHAKGFKDTDALQKIDGIIFTPMKLDIYNFKKYEEKDFNYLYQTKKECFKWYVEKLYGPWDDKFQIEIFKEFIEKNMENINIIKYKNEMIGMFTNHINKNNESEIGLFYIDKKYQGRGIGKEILKEQLKIDETDKRNTILQVFKENPARFLYKKVGFEIYDETKSHYKMIRKLK